jgi:hypothetical protein
MTALSIKNRKLYDQIGSSEISLSEFTAFLQETTLFDKVEGYVFGWATVLYLGTFNDLSPEKLKQEFQELGVWDPSGKEKDDFQIELDKSSKAFGYLSRSQGLVFPKIYQILEGLRTLAGK